MIIIGENLIEPAILFTPTSYLLSKSAGVVEYANCFSGEK